MSTFKVGLKTIVYNVPKDELSQHAGMQAGGELALDLCTFLQKAVLLLLSNSNNCFMNSSAVEFILWSITLYLRSLFIVISEYEKAHLDFSIGLTFRIQSLLSKSSVCINLCRTGAKTFLSIHLLNTFHIKNYS